MKRRKVISPRAHCNKWKFFHPPELRHERVRLIECVWVFVTPQNDDFIISMTKNIIYILLFASDMRHVSRRALKHKREKKTRGENETKKAMNIIEQKWVRESRHEISIWYWWDFFRFIYKLYFYIVSPSSLRLSSLPNWLFWMRCKYVSLSVIKIMTMMMTQTREREMSWKTPMNYIPLKCIQSLPPTRSNVSACTTLI